MIMVVEWLLVICRQKPTPIMRPARETKDNNSYFNEIRFTVSRFLALTKSA